MFGPRPIQLAKGNHPSLRYAENEVFVGVVEFLGIEGFEEGQ